MKMSKIRYFAANNLVLVLDPFFSLDSIYLRMNIGRSDLRFLARKHLQTWRGVPPAGSCKMRRIFLSAPAWNKPEYY